MQILAQHHFFSQNKQAAPTGAFAGLSKKQSDIPQPLIISEKLCSRKRQPPTQAACAHAALRGDFNGFFAVLKAWCVTFRMDLLAFNGTVIAHVCF